MRVEADAPLGPLTSIALTVVPWRRRTPARRAAAEKACAVWYASP